MVPLLQSLFAKTLPDILLFDHTSLLDSHRQITTFDSEIETGHGVLHEMQSDLGETLLLQVGDNALTDEVRGANDLKHFIIVFLDQRELESVLCRVDCDCPGLCLSIQTVDRGSLYSCQVNGLVESLDDTVITAILSR